ncbi:class I SAM-dependent methyltransferase [Segetibacter aerophilus]|uniref:Cyclopropane-fatty-acyl-phospholipid synthase n=1 Tax=Segetibacter aerophilus TaxID=670293 RepID=A0A512B853_9BACT|nr:class I SAM-dependent methyltransferase [Segetibacter aerophilus]GEO08099.1 cyclopropane-fatty-acyl-phospholipid synthase [Segetibacter aerophilus]
MLTANGTDKMPKKFSRLVSLVEKQYQSITPGTGNIPFGLRMNGSLHTFGDKAPAFTIKLNDEQAVAALSTLDQNTIAEAYLEGKIDLEGDIMRVLALRELFNDKRGMQFLWRFVQPMLFGQVKSDKKWISNHYDTEEDFFLLFLDKRHRAYSQAVFLKDEEQLEDAVTRKLDFALEAVNAKPGDRILDIGSGWGAFVEYAGKKGIKVTSLTISKRSKVYVQKIIDQHNLPCEVLLEHFLEHNPGEQYDAIVNCGVTEHLPDYASSLKHYQKLLKPGGRLYLDASADRVKHGQGTFMSKYVFEGNASLLCLHEYLCEVAKSNFEVTGVWNDRHNYYLTTKAWAERLDSHREEIERRWGKKLYRIFQLYLWGSAEGFHSGMIDAYRVVLTLI